jgi:mersacidin/lichenicidin family type 2 lantibiotic
MSKIDVIRAWKDEAYRMSLTPEQRSALPANPAGLIELQDADLDDVVGGARPVPPPPPPPRTQPGSGCGTGTGTGTGTHTGTGTRTRTRL